jgi:acyl dehydratase
MVPVTESQFLRSYQVDAAGQEAFCRFSGDFNPLHADPVAARRTMVGGQAVHGIHLALAAADSVAEHLAVAGQSPAGIGAIAATFLKSVQVGESLEFHLVPHAAEALRVEGRIRDEAAVRVDIRFGPNPPTAGTPVSPLSPERIAEAGFEGVLGTSGSLPLGLDPALARSLFPHLFPLLGPAGLAGLTALSRLVGMRCPGLYSLFGGFSISFHAAAGEMALAYTVKKADERFGRIVMRVSAPVFAGEVTAFFRPPPEPQPLMAEVMRVVTNDTFPQSIALIIGGSRGLGETTARIIAAGGGLPIITYLHGAADAGRVRDDIVASGGRCETMRLDVREPEAAIAEFFANRQAPRTMYYFATPKIFGRRRGFFDYELLRGFEDIYVTAFGRLVDLVSKLAPGGLRVFYPSSIAVDESLREMAEYAIAKRLSEEICTFYNRYSETVRIVVERLPRLRTDQTGTLLPVDAQDCLSAMLPIVQHLESSPHGCQKK